MIGFAWLAIRQAQEAIRNGRLEDAQRLLSQSAVQGHRRQPALLADLARAFAERGAQLLRNEQVEAAWRDLLQAEQVQKANGAALQLRQSLVRLALAEIRAQLTTGEPGRAEQAIARYRGRGLASAELDVLDESVKCWNTAREQAGRGDFARAQETCQRLSQLLPDAGKAVEQFRSELEQRQRTCAALLVQLNKSSAAGRWSEVIELAGQVLAVAPHHEEARRLRTQAWRAVEPVTMPGINNATVVESNQAVGEGGPAPRYLLWIDGVGGFLICLGSKLTLGQAVPGARVDVPLAADVSRLHATLTRDAEGWVVEALRPVRVNGAEVTQTLLRTDDRITLGASCQLIFRQPVPVSQSARLDIVSGHRLPLALDAVLLMADTLVLDGGPQAHVTIPGLAEPLVLFRSRDQLGLRYGGKLRVNGVEATGRQLLDAPAAVVAGDLSFYLEPAGPRLGDGGDASALVGLIQPRDVRAESVVRGSTKG